MKTLRTVTSSIGRLLSVMMGEGYKPSAEKMKRDHYDKFLNIC